MKVSFIIPTYNNADLLAKTLAGLVAQKHNSLSWEVIVIDNNSVDESVALVHRKFRSVLPITLILQSQLPHPFALSKARNLGIRLARGEWIASIDADTIPNQNYLNTLESRIKEWKNISVIMTSERNFISTSEVDPRDIMTNPILLEQLPIVLSSSNYGLIHDRRLPIMKSLPDIEHPWDYMHGCNVIFRRKDALKIGGYEEAYDGQWGFEDIDFAYRMITENQCIPYYVPGLHVYHQDLSGRQPSINRNDKSTNPNWARICQKIPGYQDYKIAKYRKLSNEIKV